MKHYVWLETNDEDFVVECHDEIKSMVYNKTLFEAIDELAINLYEIAVTEKISKYGSRWIFGKVIEQVKINTVQTDMLMIEQSSLLVNDKDLDVYENVRTYLFNKYPDYDSESNLQHLINLDIVKRLGWTSFKCPLNEKGKRTAWGAAHPKFDEYIQAYGCQWGASHPDDYRFYQKLSSGYQDLYFTTEEEVWNWVVDNVEFAIDLNAAMSLFHKLHEIHIVMKYGDDYCIDNDEDCKTDISLYRKTPTGISPLNISIRNRPIDMASAISMCWIQLQISLEKETKL